MAVQTEYTVNTITGIMNRLMEETKIPLGLTAASPLLNTTLNAKYNIEKLSLPVSYPGLRYAGIGISGCYNSNTGNLINTYVPSANNQDLYQPIPWRIRPLDEDLTALERAQYRMRVILTINNITYVAYYLKVLTMPMGVNLKLVDVNNQVSDYTIIPNLTPVPVIPVGEPNTLGQNKVVAEVNAQIIITQEEIMEAVNVLFEGDNRYGRISEIGIYSGEDKINVIGQAANAGTVTYTESIYTQLSIHRTSQGNGDLVSSTQTITLGNGNLYLVN